MPAAAATVKTKTTTILAGNHARHRCAGIVAVAVAINIIAHGSIWIQQNTFRLISGCFQILTVSLFLSKHTHIHPRPQTMSWVSLHSAPNPEFHTRASWVMYVGNEWTDQVGGRGGGQRPYLSAIKRRQWGQVRRGCLATCSIRTHCTQALARTCVCVWAYMLKMCCLFFVCNVDAAEYYRQGLPLHTTRCHIRAQYTLCRQKCCKRIETTAEIIVERAQKALNEIKKKKKLGKELFCVCVCSTRMVKRQKVI